MIHYDYVSKVTNDILKEGHTKEGPTFVVSDHWTKHFLNRHSELYKTKQKSLELERKLVHNSDLIQN